MLEMDGPARRAIERHVVGPSALECGKCQQHPEHWKKTEEHDHGIQPRLEAVAGQPCCR